MRAIPGQDLDPLTAYGMLLEVGALQPYSGSSIAMIGPHVVDADPDPEALESRVRGEFPDARIFSVPEYER